MGKTSLLWIIGMHATLLLNCGGKKQEGSHADTVPVAGDTIAYTLAGFEVKSKDCRNEDSACAMAHYSYPELGAAAPQALRDSLAAVWADLFGACAQGQGPRACAEAFIKSYEETQAQARKAGMDYTIPWYSNVSATVVQWQGPGTNIFGIQAVADEFGGGAHPSTVVSTFHLDPATGRRLGYADVFPDTAALRQRIEQSFYRHYGLALGKPLSQDSRFFGEARLALPAVWMPEGDSLYLYWNTYHLGPRTTGDFDLKVDVKGLYRDNPVP